MAADGSGWSELIIFTMCTTWPLIQSLLTTYKYFLTSSTLLTLHVLRLFAWSFEMPLKFGGSPHELLFSLLSSLSSPLNKPNPIHHNSTHSFKHVLFYVCPDPEYQKFNGTSREACKQEVHMLPDTHATHPLSHQPLLSEKTRTVPKTTAQLPLVILHHLSPCSVILFLYPEFSVARPRSNLINTIR